MSKGNSTVHHKGKSHHYYKHGMSGTRFHSIWKHINGRCNAKTTKSYPYYGGRGIQNHWKLFEDFKKDMYSSYKRHSKRFGEKNTTIERIDVNGDYCKKNCRWATRYEQSRNMRSNHFITFKGKTRCVADWAKHLGIRRGTLIMRIYVLKWPLDKAFNTMVK